MDGHWQIGHVPAEQYAILAQQTARMMKMVDPTIEVVACGSCATNLPTYLEWDRKVLAHLRDDTDFLSLHSYVGNSQNDTEDYLAVINTVDDQIEATDALCTAMQRLLRTKRKVRLSFDEWNVWYRARDGAHVDGNGKFAPPLLEEKYNLEDALVVAGYLNSFIRHADSVKIANIAQIVNVIAPILTSGDEMLLQTIYYPFEMFSRRRTGTSLRVSVDGPGYVSKSYGPVKNIDASAILNGQEVSVFLINRSLDKPTEVKIRLGDQSISTLVAAEIVTGTDPKATNTFDAPNQVVSAPHHEVAIENGVATVVLPPLAAYAGTFTLA
jgi:alpha-N-arabinofuranosidase